ncbi:MAG: outer spore coat protein CotE [bacterium]
MSEIREIVTKAVIAKGKKTLILNENIPTTVNPYSILGCWIINHEFEATKTSLDSVKIIGEFEINIWYSESNNTKTEIIRETIQYTKDIQIKTIVKDFIENTDDILARIIQHPTVTNAKIFDDSIEAEISLEILAEVIGETKMKVTVFNPETTWEDEVDVTDMDINEEFINLK